MTCNKPEDLPPTSDAAHLYIIFEGIPSARLPHHAILGHPLLKTGYKLDEENSKLIPVMMNKDPIPRAVIELISCQ